MDRPSTRVLRAGVVSGLLLLMLTGPASLARSQSSVGLTPLPDLRDGTYQGFSGGLYPGHAVERPPFHESTGRALAQEVVPRDTSGQPHMAGLVGLISIGMSNTTQEWQEFMTRVQSEPDLHPQLRIIDGAEGGQEARTIADPAAAYWTTTIPSRLAQAGVTAEQIQVVWLKEAVAFPMAPFPDHAEELHDLLVTIVQILHDTFPNLKICYLSSRTFGGYATGPLNPEPYAYEGGFAFKWLIEDQINGAPELEYLEARGPVMAPWLSWGPYLWADGPVPRPDGLIWNRQDFVSDGVHPASSGRQKVAQLLTDHFLSDLTATPWFRKTGNGPCQAPAEIYAYGQGVANSTGVPNLTASTRPSVPTSLPFAVRCDGLIPGTPGLMLLGWEMLASGTVPLYAGSLLVIPRLSFVLLANGNGRALLGGVSIPADPAICGGFLAWQYLATDPSAPQSVALSRGLAMRLGD